MPNSLPHADIRHLHLTLADAASGHALQWWHLELAAALPAASPSWRGRTLAWLTRLLGHQRCAPWLAAAGMPGMQPYRLDGPPANRDLARDAGLIGLVVLAMLIGRDTLNASRQLLLILLGVLGAALVAGRRWHLASTYRRGVLAAQAEQAEHGVGSENALGLTALMLAAGMPMDKVREQYQALLAAPDRATTEQLARLGLQLPASGWVSIYALHAGAAWLSGVAAIAWPCWLTGASWQAAPAALGLLVLYYVLLGESHQWWRIGVRNVLIAAACLGLSTLVRWL